MGHQIIKQPDGRLAVWSSIVDGLILLDATAEDLAEHYAQRAYREMRSQIIEKATAVLEGRGEEVYGRLALTYEKALREHESRHGPLEDSFDEA